MTQDAAQARKGTGLSVAGWPLGRKMALALAIPLLLAAVLGGLRVSGDYGDSRQAARSAQQVTIIQPAVDYLTASETAMVAAQSDSAASQGDLIDAISDISTNAETLVEARDGAELDELQTAHVNALLDLSQAMRGEGAETLGPATWIALVRQLESSVSQLITSVNAAQETPEPRLEQLSQAMSGRLSLALQQGLIATTLSQSSSQELFSEIGVEAAAIDRLAGSVEGADDQTALLRQQNTRHAGQIRDDAATDLDGRDAYAPYDEITETLVTGVTKTLDDAAGAAQRNALVGAVLTLLALAAAIALAFFIARSLLGPIGKVRDGALAVARHRLPDAVARIRAGQEPEPIKTIDVHTNEEIGQVARAVDDLHRQAIHLASGEAQLRQTVNAMFVTLSRRSTSLVNQQLAQIERLEHDEEDPKRLESLFRLDHLASRMRRTADSLLILADAPNRAAGQFSLTVGEALQAATSGVQDYQRVQILSNLNTRVGDEAAADVVHLLTELVDNALSFSPPAEPVRLAAKQGPEGVTITITDSGLGVPPAELEQLNGDLQHGAEATPDTARRMGLFVVSRLAERHDITAHLARNPGGGMTASVLLPPSVLPDVSQSGAPAAPAATTTAAPSSPVRHVDGLHRARRCRGSRRPGRLQARGPQPGPRREGRGQGRRARRRLRGEGQGQGRQGGGRPGAGAGRDRYDDRCGRRVERARRAPPLPPPRPPRLRSRPRTVRRSAACCRAATPVPTCPARVPTPSCRRRPPAPRARSSASVPTPPHPPPRRTPPVTSPRRPSAPRRSPASSRSPPWPRASVRRPSRRRAAPRSLPRLPPRSRPRSRWPRSRPSSPSSSPSARGPRPAVRPAVRPAARRRLRRARCRRAVRARRRGRRPEPEPARSSPSPPPRPTRSRCGRGRGRRRRPAGSRSPGPADGARQPAGRPAGQPARAGARQRGRGRARPEPQPEERAEPELEPVPSYDAAALLTDGHGLNGHGQRQRHQRLQRSRVERPRQQRPVARCRAGPRRRRVPDLQVDALRLARRRGQGRVARDRGRPWLGDRRARLRAGAGRRIHPGRTAATCPW